MNAPPSDLEVKKIGATTYEILEHRNVTEVTNVDDEVKYKSDLTILTANILTREELVVALISMRYSKDDELNLINKFFLDNTNQEYLDYRNYVVSCKERSHLYFID